MMQKSGDALVERSRAALRAIGFQGGRSLSVTFRTDPALIAAMLPPGLEPVASPIMRCGVSQFASGTCGPFRGASVCALARHGDLVGMYVLAMWVDTAESMIFGRELCGEPKTLCRAELAFDGARKTALIETATDRIELSFDSGVAIGPSVVEGANFTYLTAWKPGGLELDHDPYLLALETRAEMRAGCAGTARLTLGGGGGLERITIEEIVDASYAELDTSMTVRTLGTVPAEDYLPFAYAGLPDWHRLSAERG